jgi:hypothetical protein
LCKSESWNGCNGFEQIDRESRNAMRSQLLSAETRMWRRGWIPPPRCDLLKLPGHQFLTRMTGKENSTGSAPGDSGPGIGRPICIRGYLRLRRAREDLSALACRHQGVTVPNRDVGAVEEHPGPSGIAKETREPSPRLARGRPKVFFVDSREPCTPSQRMRRLSM